MRDINIARTLTQKRKEKNITQDELASYIGVSKASVSKWETGQSYPDITFLPQLAAYFNISVDELIGYEPQMTRADIRALYHRLSGDFVTEPFESVMEECRSVLKKYFACFPLLVEMGILLINTGAGANEEQKRRLTAEAKALFCRVRTECGEWELVRQARYFEAACCLGLGEAAEALELLEGTNAPQISSEALLASAYQLTGNLDKAKSTLQVGIYKNLVSILNLAPSYMMLHADDRAAFEGIFRRTRAVAEVFEFEKLHPSPVMSLYLIAAMGFTELGDSERALDLLQDYANLVINTEYPLRLHGDGFFYCLENWMKENDFDLEPPRDERAIKKGMVDAVTGTTMFAALSESPRYRNIVQRLQTALL